MSQYTTDKERTVVIVGAGITGLAAAYRLSRIAQRKGKPLKLHLLEASERVGGVIQTEQLRGFTFELGPDSMITDKPWGRELCEDVGLRSRIIRTNDEHRVVYIAHERGLYPIPQGFHLLAPSKLGPFLRSPILSTGGKLRALADMVLPRRKTTDDESLASFVRRRLGAEVLEKIAQPLVGGIYTADPEQLSVAATLPQFVEMERKHRSVILATMAAGSEAGTGVGEAVGPRSAMFISLDEGLSVLPEQVRSLLPQGCLRTNARVESLDNLDGAWRVRGNGFDIYADAVCLAMPSHAAAPLLRPHQATLAETLAAIHYASSATINLAFKKADVPRDLKGFGFVVPAAHKRTTLACTFSSFKFQGRAPGNQTLVRAFAGGALFPQKWKLRDVPLMREVLNDLRDLVGITATPTEVIITRWPESMPQYYVDHPQRIASIETMLEELPGVYLAGNAYHGVGIPDCIHSGQTAAERIGERIFRTAIIRQKVGSRA